MISEAGRSFFHGCISSVKEDIEASLIHDLQKIIEQPNPAQTGRANNPLSSRNINPCFQAVILALKDHVRGNIYRCNKQLTILTIPF